MIWGGPSGGVCSKAWGEMPNVGEGEKESKAHCHVCSYATVLHALLMYPKTYNPIKNKETTSATPEIITIVTVVTMSLNGSTEID